jgi:hypothetical protein
VAISFSSAIVLALAAVDNGFVSFADNETPIMSGRSNASASRALNLDASPAFPY